MTARPTRILVADDDPALRELIARVLRRRGYRVAEVRDGAAVLDAIGDSLIGAHRAPPDLIVADIQMPYVTGLQVLAALVSIEPPIPLVLITAFGDAATHALADRLGAAALLDKPFEIDALCDVIARAVARAPAPPT